MTNLFLNKKVYDQLVKEIIISTNNLEYIVEYMSKSKDKRIRLIAQDLKKELA